MGDMELQIFSDRLKILRRSLNITQKDFAEKIGITAAALSSYENNLKNPSISVAKRIAEAFDISIDWLCGLSEQKELKPEIKTYKDIAVRILEILQLDMGFNSFYLHKEQEDDFIIQSIALPQNKELMQFFETYSDLQTLLRNSKIKQHVINTWLEGSLAELAEIPINTLDGVDEVLPVKDE